MYVYATQEERVLLNITCFAKVKINLVKVLLLNVVTDVNFKLRGLLSLDGRVSFENFVLYVQKEFSLL